MTQYIKRLPEVFQTTTEKQFFDATFDQVFTKKDSSYLAGYLGRRDPGSYDPINDFYIPEPNKDRTWWQLEATAYAENADSTKTNVFFYEDLLNRINYYNGNTLNEDRLFESEYYSFGPPIDYDMFINYQNYYWVEAGLPVVNITGLPGAPILASDIIGQPSYTTPSTATPPNFTLSSGMTIKLLDDPLYPNPVVVENMGGCVGIQFIPELTDTTIGSIFEFLPWDGQLQISTGRVIQNSYWDQNTWDTETQPVNGDYITIERGAATRNAWSRTNKWFNVQTINEVLSVTGSSFPVNATAGLRPIIQFVANLELYNSGTQFRDEIAYGFGNNQFGDPYRLLSFQGQPADTLNITYNINLTNGDLVVFFNDTTSYEDEWDDEMWDDLSPPLPWDPSSLDLINQFIWQVNISLGGIVTFTPYTSLSTPVVQGDIVIVDNTGPYDSALGGSTWYYSNGTWQEAFNDKISVNQPPLFQLYDYNGIQLQDPTTYPGSTFEGSEIFSYDVNKTPGAIPDFVLGFAILYTALGQASDIIFENDLITTRYTYSNFLPINGYYYYMITGDPVLYNNWNLYDICSCSNIVPPPPVNCIELSKQRVIDQYVVGYGTLYQFQLSVVPYGYPTLPDILVTVNGLTINAYVPITNPNGYTITNINTNVYVDLTNYLTNLFLTTQTTPPVVQIQTYPIFQGSDPTINAEGLLDPSATGYFQIPQQLEANPSQLEVGQINGSDLIQHFASIISNQIGFTGVAYGGPNNYRDSRKNRSLGSYILQNVAPTLKTMLVSQGDALDFIQAIRFSQNTYTKFKNKYTTVAQQLINQEFNPVQYQNNSIVISGWVDQILSIINISKEYSNAFAYSYMVASGTPTYSESHTVPGNSLVSLTNYIDLTNPENVMYVYDATNPALPVLLLVNQDYTITSTNLVIDVQLNLGAPVKTIVFYLYQNPLPTYIPSTPTKLGMYPTYLPRIETDYSYAIPTQVLIGHDGSKTVLFGTYNTGTGVFSDYRDALLIELERRIYNGIQSKFISEYFVPLRVESVQTGYFRSTRYTRQEYLDITQSYLNKWCAKNRASYATNNWPTASQTTPVNELWKLYNYRDAINPAGQPLNLPGNWKGIYQFYYDTFYPDIRPWEMLGFSQQPKWWISQYGPPAINANGQPAWPNTLAYSLMWSDIEAGIVRQGPTAIYDPYTLLPQSQPLWARPGLSAMNLIPVDSSGNIIPIPTLFNVQTSGNPYEPYDGFDADWIYGDGAPVEQAWLSTSGYVFNTQEFLYLMRPGPFGELQWETLGTEVAPGQLLNIPGIETPVLSNTNWQYVQNEAYANLSGDPFFYWMRPKNADQYVHAETINGVVQVRFGYQVWISDNILFSGADITSTFGQKIRTLDVNLANKFAGFTNETTINTYIQSVTPGSATNTLVIPSTNLNVILQKGPPVATYTYSGVIVRALADGTFVVYGYDLLNAAFTTLDRTNNQLINISVGGTPASYQNFVQNATYGLGAIVKYNGVYYQSLADQTVDVFSNGQWQKLAALPVVGGISVIYKPISATTTTIVPYGTILNTTQEVFDFLIGWGAYLSSQGWQFENVDPTTNMVSDWLYSAKQFLFWLNTSWAPNAAIQLSPLANTATLIVSSGYPDDVETMSNDIYSILDKYGTAISPSNTVVERDGQTITVSPLNLSSGGIYFLLINSSETEHVLIFDNTTSFNDIIYDPLLRARQERIRFNGFRNNGWYGKMEAAGYLIINNQLVPNYDTIVDSIRYFYNPNVILDNQSLEQLGRHLIGFSEQTYLDNMEITGNIQYMFYQGAIRQKGTDQSINALFRSSEVRPDGESIAIYEEWALKLGEFGSTVEQVSTEFVLQPDQNSGQVIVARLNYVPSTIGFVKEIVILNAQNTYTVIPKIVIGPPDASPTDPALTGPLRQATAYAVLTNNVISRVDIIDPGYGYLKAPNISIQSPQAHDLDVLYSLWQGQYVIDTVPNNIIDISLSQTNLWTVRPVEPQYSLVFPTTPKIDYLLPNAGYVNFNDVNLYVFNNVQAIANWGKSSAFNPIKNNTIWVANTFPGDWDVYKLIDISSITFTVVADSAGNLDLLLPAGNSLVPQFGSSSGQNPVLGPRTDYITDFGNLIVLQVIEATATATITLGSISAIVLVQEGANYYTIPNVIITGDGTNATATATIAGGVVTGFIITNPGSGYTHATVTISPPTSVAGSTNNIVGFVFDAAQSSVDLTHNYYDLVDLNGNPITANDLPDYANYTNLLIFSSMRIQPGQPIIAPSYAVTGDKVWVDQFITSPAPLWAVTITTAPSTPLTTVFREQSVLIDTSLFQSASIFDNNNNELSQLPIYDPFKTILPGPARQNITYITEQDPASYNVTQDPSLFSENITFDSRQVGQLWWDLSAVKYVYYEQPIALDGSESETQNLIYRRDHWGQIFPGSTVNIYEWVQSSVPPSQYTGSGVPKDVNTYVQVTTVDKFTDAIVVNYYFWVLGATDQPNIENRTLPAVDVSLLLQSPLSQNFSFFCPIQQTSTNNSYMFYNVLNILAYQGNNVQIQYRVSESNVQKHAQWSFFREGDTDSIVTPQFWNKMVDSLCAYTQVLPVSPEFPNGILVANYLPWDIYGWDVAPWDNATSTTTPIYGLILPVPDPDLSDIEQLGVQYRPRQGMFYNLSLARQVFVEAANALLQYIPIRDSTPSWNANVQTETYWTYTNYYAPGFVGVTPTIIYPNLTAANAALQSLQIGTIVQVNNSTADGLRYILYQVVQLNPNVPTLSFNEVGIQNSAIMFLDTLYTTYNIYGLSVELRQMLNALRTEVMVDGFIIDQNELFFSMLNYVVSEKKNPDWVFKSSNIFIDENNIPLTQPQLFVPDQISNVLQYITDVKPHHTNIRSYSAQYVYTDIAIGTASDTFKFNEIIAFGPGLPGSPTNPGTNVGIVQNQENIIDPEIGWDLDQGPADQPFDSFEWDYTSIADVIDQFISGDPALDPNLYEVPLTFPDPSKVPPWSQLFPYTFTFDGIIGLNPPQTFITPNNVFGVQIGTKVLIAGQDFYVEFNNDNTPTSNGTYTIYFYNNPGSSPVPVALVWWDGGGILRMPSYQTGEIALGFPSDDFVVNVDNQLVVNISGGILYPYMTSGSVLAGSPIGLALAATAMPYSLIATGGPLTPYPLVNNVISYKENTNVVNGANFYRNSQASSGTLLNSSILTFGTITSGALYTDGLYTNVLLTGGTGSGATADIIIVGGSVTAVELTNIGDSSGTGYVIGDVLSALSADIGGTGAGFSIPVATVGLPAPIASTENTQTIIINSAFGLPLPTPTSVPAIWIDGERIEYKEITSPSVDIWILTLVRRGTMGTSPENHSTTRISQITSLPVSNPVWIEQGNIMPTTSNTDIWNTDGPAIPDVTQPCPGGYTSVTNVPLGGLWYANTSESTFLTSEQGISIP